MAPIYFREVLLDTDNLILDNLETLLLVGRERDHPGHGQLAVAFRAGVQARAYRGCPSTPFPRHLRRGPLLPGVPIDQVSIVLGHSSVKITERHYRALVAARLQQIADSLRLDLV